MTRNRQRPIIGISSYGRDGELPSFSLPCGYIDAVRAAGGTPLVLPPGEANPEQLLDLVDGFVLAGGGDIAPGVYGGDSHETIYMVSEERDNFELSLARGALERPHLPMLCICRGLQVLNIASGGTLYPHIPDQFGDSVNHRLPPRSPTRHAVNLEADTLLGRIVGSTEIDACSWHHQAVRDLGEGLRPVAWAPDGVVEAIEAEGHSWCLAVQWHPEMQIGETAQDRLFEAFIKAAQQPGR
jgi:putative glutamine amidotransferase